MHTTLRFFCHTSVKLGPERIMSKICSSGTVQLIAVDGDMLRRAEFCEPPSVSGIPGHVGIYLFEVIG